MSEDNKIVRLATPGEVPPGQTAQMTARFLHGGEIKEIELDEGASWVAVLAANKRIESDDGAELTAERLALLGPVPNRGFAIVVVKNDSDVAKVLTGRLVMDPTAEIEEKAPVLAVSPAASEPRVVQVNPEASTIRNEPRVVQVAGGTSGIMRGASRMVESETKRAGDARRIIEAKPSASGTGARRIASGEGQRMKMKGGASSVTSRRMNVSPTVRETAAAKAFKEAEAVAKKAANA